ncbi:hypothetical protein Tsubulata_023778 [Turnera subulata]|uniref:DUF639 domain-containing protein n=1 Tax=Turnera subulata TaxID=218843 RepID=A0A9Q0F755_9ROSI|nr:hypothetical protein Tsubulata_023778 [Turnera subulata]
MWENFLKNHQSSLKSLFQRKRSPQLGDDAMLLDSAGNSPIAFIPLLSPPANSVVARCSNHPHPSTSTINRILGVPSEELQRRFDAELAAPDSRSKQGDTTYARNFLEFCSYQTILEVTTRRPPDYLGDKDFRRLTYDMMLAWDSPTLDFPSPPKGTASPSCKQDDDEDGWSIFYTSSTNMAVQVDETKTVGREAFVRIAPACAVIADIITVHNLFDALTSSSGDQLHFLIYDKYLRSLDKIIRASKNPPGPLISSLQLAEGEIILEVDGTVPTQPVLQHIGISAWPGRLTLTNHAIYFESLGVGLYDKATRYDLVADLKQVIRPELTGPLGARLFDKAVMYKSTALEEPVFFEFPEFKGNSRRDYWLDVCLEILHANRFIRKYNLKETKQLEVLARASLGILRYRAVREAFRYFSSHYKTLLAFRLAESLPGGDRILETLARRLALLGSTAPLNDVSGSQQSKQQSTLSAVALVTLSRLGFALQKEENLVGEVITFGDLCAGEINLLEVAVKQSISDTGRAEAAQETVNKVKVEGIDTNVAVMKELLFPFIEICSRLQRLASWEERTKSTLFMAVSCYSILRGWTGYILPSIFVWCACMMLIRGRFNKEKPLEAFKVTAPPNKNAVEQLLTLQEGIAQVEAFIQTGNVILLKIRALLFAVLPQATERVALMLVLMAGVIAFVPWRYIILVFFVEAFTRKMPRRKESSERWVRRFREWWVRIPAAPVQLIKLEDNKKKKK